MKTITIVYDPATCCEQSEPDDDDYDLFGQIVGLLDDAGVTAEINEYAGDVRPLEDPRVLITIKGGTFQGARANLKVRVELFDVDVLKTEGKTAAERQAIWEALAAELPVLVA